MKDQIYVQMALEDVRRAKLVLGAIFIAKFAPGSLKKSLIHLQIALKEF